MGRPGVKTNGKEFLRLFAEGLLCQKLDKYPNLPIRKRAKKRLDRNPASCKIQYPMKNRDKDAAAFLEKQAGNYVIFYGGISLVNRSCHQYLLFCV